MAGVGTGTIARYNLVMNSDDGLMDRFVQMLSNGEIGGSAKKVGKRIKELERLYGIQHGGDRSLQDEKNSSCVKSQDQLASDLGMDVRTLQNYKILSEMIPELEELLDTGVVTKYFIATKMNNLVYMIYM